MHPSVSATAYVCNGQINDGLGILEDEMKILHLLPVGSSPSQAQPVFQQSWRSAFLVPWAPDEAVHTWG